MRHRVKGPNTLNGEVYGFGPDFHEDAAVVNIFLYAASQAGFALIYDSGHQAEEPVKAERSEFIAEP